MGQLGQPVGCVTRRFFTRGGRNDKTPKTAEDNDRVVGSELLPEHLSKPGEGENTRSSRVEVVECVVQLAIDVVWEPLGLLVHGLPVGLVVDACAASLPPRPHDIERHAHRVLGVVSVAALPDRTGQFRRDRRSQPLAASEVFPAHGRRSCSTPLRCRASPRAGPGPPDARPRQHLSTDTTSTTAWITRPPSGLHRQRVGAEEDERADLGHVRCRNWSTCLSRSVTTRETCDFDSKWTDPEGFHQFVHAPG